MKFQIGDKVVVRATGRTGEITQWKVEQFVKNNHIETIKRYAVSNSSYYGATWYKEEDLQLDNVFDIEFEVGLLDLLIDVYLSARKFYLVKEMYNQKKIMECEEDVPFDF